MLPLRHEDVRSLREYKHPLVLLPGRLRRHTPRRMLREARSSRNSRDITVMAERKSPDLQADPEAQHLLLQGRKDAKPFEGLKPTPELLAIAMGMPPLAHAPAWLQDNA